MEFIQKGIEKLLRNGIIKENNLPWRVQWLFIINKLLKMLYSMSFKIKFFRNYNF